MILVWGPSTDTPLQFVIRELNKEKASYFLLDQLEVLNSDIKLDVSSSINEAYIRINGQILDLKKVKSVYIRAYDSTKIADVHKYGVGSMEFMHAFHFDNIMYTWLELSDALIINKLDAMSTNSSKPYQTELIRESGLKIPKTIITTNKQKVKEFHKKYKNIIYKSISGVRSIVSKYKREDYNRLNNLTWCPTQFQEHIDGQDYRVHVVNEKIFSCKIITSADDYRYSSRQGGTTEIYAENIPKDIENKCIEVSKKLDLLVSGIDLRRSNDGEWYCFEANPSPGFSYYEQYTKLPIANAIAKLLIDSPK